MAREMKDSGIEWIGLVPEDWQYIKLKTYFSFEKGKNAQMYTAEYIGQHEGQYPVYSGQTENNGVMGRIDTYEYELDECLFSTTVGAKAMTAMLLKGKFSLSQNCLIMRKIKKCDANFFFYALGTLFDYEKGSIPMYMQPSLRMEDLKKFNLYIPAMNKQVKISVFLNNICSELDNILVKIRASIEEYKKLKQATITQAVTQGVHNNRKMKDSGIEWVGEIPIEWHVKKLRYLGECQNGISKPSEYFGDGYPFVSYGDVYRNYQLPETVNGLIMSTDSDRENYSVIRGDVLFTRTSETIEEVGFSSVCLKTIEHATFAGFVIRFRPTTNELLPEYSKYYFRSDMHRRFFVKEMNLVTRASLGQELLKKLPVILPPLQEQLEIANYLEKRCGEIDRIIAKKEQYITELESYKKSLIYEYVTGKREVPQEYKA